ncbi:hypothetical protein KG088_17445, partial [Halomonas sp. TRM85114]|uniref:hypothetical protein n=1 Tax=Halomonas jincaotanensis TaxID=2810616 RepID=UPI001BD3C403
MSFLARLAARAAPARTGIAPKGIVRRAAAEETEQDDELQAVRRQPQEEEDKTQALRRQPE